MVLTVTLNPVLDRVVEIEDFEPGGVNKVSRERARIAGGKGINVSRMLKLLDTPTLAIGWLGGITGEEIKGKLEKEEICHDFLWIRGETRSNLTIIDPKKGAQTHIVEPGPRISTGQVEKLKHKILEYLARAEIVVFSGSAPPGAGEAIYFNLIELVKDKNPGIISVLDTRGAYLKEGIKAYPHLVKPNVDELSQITGRKFYSLNEVIHEVQKIQEEGIGVVVVSQGAGEVIVVADKILILTPPEVKPVNSVGAGDALVGGIVAGLYQGKDLPNACSLGIAAGAASCEKGRERPLEKKRVDELIREVKVREFS